jgi:myo-inositol-1(or 4)-monophosphatase
VTLGPVELDEILDEARAVADEAAALLLAGLGRASCVAHKGEVDLVTEYDRRAEELILERLLGRFPGWAVRAEESGVHGAPDAEATWIVDPLDGTTNFSHGHPVFAVSLGLSHRGELVAGVVTAPALAFSVWARQGGGAFSNGAPARVSSTDRLEAALVATGFPYDRRTATDDNTREYVAFVKRALGLRRCGAAAVDLALVARGVYDGYFEPRLHPWDVAAGAVIVAEAGGRISDYDGAPMDPERGWIAASNGRIHSQMLSLIREARSTLPS